MEILPKGRSAVVTMELQRGVVGDLSSFPELAHAVETAGVLRNVARLCAAARTKEVPVVHCTAGFLADRRGSPANAPLITAMLRRPEHLLEATAAVELVPELLAASHAGPNRADALGEPQGPSDLVSHRRHGVSPFTGTDLDDILRERGVESVVAVGVSLNLGIIGLAIEAVNLGYRVVVPTDAVAGIPATYSSDVLRHTLALVATLSSIDEIVPVL